MSDEVVKEPVHSPQEKENEIKQSVHNIQFLSYSLIFLTFLGFAGLLVLSETFRSFFVFGESFLRNVITVLRIILGITAIFLIGMWIAATMHELSLWINHLQIVFVKYQVYLAMVVGAVALGVMLLMIGSIILFSGYFSLFLLFTYWSQWLSNEYFSRALAKTPRTANNAMVLEALETYWLRRPQLARIATMMFVSLVAFALSITSRFGPQKNAEVLELVAYVLMILTILCGEVVVMIWRNQRDAAIASAEI